MKNEYKTQCDKCGGGTWYDKEQQCQRWFVDKTRCNLGHWHEDEPRHETRCVGTLRVIDYTNIRTYLTIGERYTFQDNAGVVKRFTLGRTTGIKPRLLLLHNSRSTGSDLLVNGPEIVALGGGVYKVNTLFA